MESPKLYVNEKYSVIAEHPLWENQRDVDMKLVNDIVKSQLQFYKTNKMFIFPHCLIFVKFGEVYYLIDGQHRREALKILFDKHGQDIEVPCMFYYCDKTIADHIYCICNRNNTNNCMLTETGEIDKDGPKLKDIHKKLRQKYGTEIWHDKKTAKPYVNLGLMDEEFKKYRFFKEKQAMKS